MRSSHKLSIFLLSKQRWEITELDKNSIFLSCLKSSSGTEAGSLILKGFGTLNELADLISLSLRLSLVLLAVWGDC